MVFRNKTKIGFPLPENNIAVWSPGANNTAQVSLELAREAARHTTVALVELPCLGIPRLAFETDILDRTNHTDMAILEYERKNRSPFDFCSKPGDNLAVLPANPYALPDHPVVHKVSNPETLKTFPAFFACQARKHGYRTVIFDCQGVFVSPMTFYSLRQAHKIILVVDRPSDIAWSLLNKKRLTEIYHFDEYSFVATSAGPGNQLYHEEIRSVLKCEFLPADKLILALTETEQTISVLDAGQQVIAK